MAATVPDSLRRTFERRNAALAALAALSAPVLTRLWRDGSPDMVLEVHSMLAEVAGTAKLAARVAGCDRCRCGRA